MRRVSEGGRGTRGRHPRRRRRRLSGGGAFGLECVAQPSDALRERGHGKHGYTISAQAFLKQSETFMIVTPELNVTRAYWLKSPSAATLAYTGDDVHDETPINLTVGLNYIAYLPRFPAPVLTALDSVVPSACNIVKDGAGGVYWHEFGLDNIGPMQPGRGYEIECQQSATLVYPFLAPPSAPLR